jgi:hypothetical protein
MLYSIKIPLMIIITIRRTILSFLLLSCSCFAISEETNNSNQQPQKEISNFYDITQKDNTSAYLLTETKNNYSINKNFLTAKIGISGIGIGYRKRINHHGFDVGINASLLWHYGEINYLYFFSKNKNSIYCGPGIRGGRIMNFGLPRYGGGGWDNFITYSLNIGYQKIFKNEKSGMFFQAQLIAPVPFSELTQLTPCFDIGFLF